MTTNNHPAHGPVSLERLHQISEILSKAAAQSDGGNLGYAMADAVKVIDEVIALFGVEHAEFLPDNLDRALTILGVALPISKEEFNLDAERWMQRLINRVIRLESELIPPAPVVPDGLRLALSNAGIAAPESDEMLAATHEKYTQMLVTWVRDRKPFQPTSVVPPAIEPDYDVIKGILPTSNPDEYACCIAADMWNACRAAMLQGGAK